MSYLNLALQDFDDLLRSDDLAETPVPLEEFIHAKQYMGIKVVSELQLKLIRNMSQILKPHTLMQLYGEEEAQRIWFDETPTEIVALCGKGSGKDFAARLAFCRIIYLLHCLKDPLGYFDKANGTYIDLLNIAVNADQAQNVFFTPLRNILSASPYFREKGFDTKKKEIEFHQRPIRLFSGNSEAEAWEGLDLMMVVLDEIAAFKTDEQFKGDATRSRLSASAIYDMSKASVTSRFSSVGKVILLSFPRYKGDYILSRYAESAQEEFTGDEGRRAVYRIKARTWEMNPHVTRQQLEPQYKRNPIDARSRFECDPPEMISAFFRDPSRVRQCFEGQWIVTDAGTEREQTNLSETPSLFPIDEFGSLKSWFKCEDEFTRYIHVDLALGRRDRAALAMVHVPGNRKIEVQQNVFEQLPVIKMDLIRYWEALPGEEIDFGDIREFIALLARRWPVGLVTYDHWQSQDSIKILENRGILCDTHSVKINDYSTLATAFYDGRFSGYFVDLLVEQELLKLQLLPNGKVDHGASGYKDGADALAGAVWNACEFSMGEQEIDLQIIGLDEDPRELEVIEALEDDRRAEANERIRRTIIQPEEEFEFRLESV